MKKEITLIAALFSLLSGSVFGQDGYWQQAIDYKIEVTVDEAKHQLQGLEKIVYTNNSPDTLNKVFFHLYFNAFQPGSMMDVRSRTIADADPRVGDRISKLSEDEIGFHKINSLHQNDSSVDFTISGTILEVRLNEPILPGEQTSFYMEFDSQVPLQIRRSGWNNKEGVEFSMSQWYPKMCEYDTDGWHSNPYIGREFHGVWGDYDVQIDIDSKYVLGGTGVIQNPEEVKNGYGGNEGKPSGERVTWKFKAENVHDFVWAADPDYVHLQESGPNGMELHFLVQPDTAYFETWKQLPKVTAQAFEIMNETFGSYPYPQYSVIQGGDGGMEYPNATLITGKRSLSSLIGVTIHELIHSWYQGMLATNEAKYPWMDEGFTTFASAIVSGKINNSAPSFQGSIIGYQRLVQSGQQEPLTTHADHYHTNRAYGVASYVQGSLVPVQLMHIIGEDMLFAGMKNYYNQWAFKHPRPDNFKRVMEKTSGVELDWFFENWIGTTKAIDYSIQEVKSSLRSQEITLANLGQFPMPVSMEIEFKDGSKKTYFIPLRIMRGTGNTTDTRTVVEEWPWTFPTYTLSIPKKEGKISRITLFPEGRVADQNFENNTWENK